MIAQLQFGHVIDCKIIIRENIEPPRELFHGKEHQFASVHGYCLVGDSIRGRYQPCKLAAEILPVLADSTRQAKLSYTVAGPRIR